jgi:hypothetical protein
MMAGCAGLLWVSPATGYPAMLAQQILLGGGLGLLVPPMTTLLMSGADDDAGCSASPDVTVRLASLRP